jgi:CHAT domain-containing protein
VLSRASGGHDDGMLQSYEIAQMNLPSSTVILSACGTALGKAVAGEGLIGLAQAFFTAGASSLVGSLWPVEDRATAELMLRLHRQLAKGVPAPAALRAAQIALLRDPVWSNPNYWAGFVAIGGSLAKVEQVVR